MSRGIPHIVMKNREFLRVEDLDTVCEQLKSIFDNQAAENSRLHENLQAITDKKWKDEELQKLKKERDDALADMYRGFSITQAEHDKINAWKKEHDENQHGLKTDMERCRAGGAIGGRYSFDFTGTSIGTFGTCYCGSCRNKAIENCGGDIKVYRKLMKEYDAEFSFQEP